MLYLLTCRAGLDWSYEFPDRTRPDRTGQDWRVLHWDVYKDSGFILNLQKFCKFNSTKFICLKLLVIKKVLNYLEVNMYLLLPHFMASMNQKKNGKVLEKSGFFPLFLFLEVLKARYPGKETSGFLDGSDFENFPDFQTRGDVQESSN